MTALLTAFIETIFPPECSACGAKGAEPFCEICDDALLVAPPFTVAGATSAVALFDYGGPIAEAIRRFKYRSRPDLARPLGALMRRRHQRRALPIDMIVPVPTTRRRAMRRGYNPAVQLARHLRGPLALDALRRLNHRPQVGLPSAARARNLASAFASGARPVHGRAILLVDDVITTGATARAAVQVLRENGADSVHVLALAREG